MTLELLDTKIDRFKEAVVSGFEHMNEKFSGLEDRFSHLETEMMKMRDEVRAIDGKVSGIWNVIDVHADRIKKLEMEIHKLKTGN